MADDAEDATNALGETVADVKPNNEVVPSCSFLPATNSSGPIDLSQIVVQIQSLTIFNGSKQSGQDGSAKANGITITSVSGLGDDAFFQSTGGSGITFIEVKKGNTVFTIDVENKAFSPDQQKTAEKILAQIALSNIS